MAGLFIFYPISEYKINSHRPRLEENCITSPLALQLHKQR